jgi:hypothetical protein
VAGFKSEWVADFRRNPQPSWWDTIGAKRMRKQSQPLVPAMLTIDDSCSYCGYARSRLYLEIKAGKLDVRKAGRRTLITRQSLDAMLDALPRAPGLGDEAAGHPPRDQQARVDTYANGHAIVDHSNLDARAAARASPKARSPSEHEDRACRNGYRKKELPHQGDKEDRGNSEADDREPDRRVMP